MHGFRGDAWSMFNPKSGTSRFIYIYSKLWFLTSISGIYQRYFRSIQLVKNISWSATPEPINTRPAASACRKAALMTPGNIWSHCWLVRGSKKRFIWDYDLVHSWEFHGISRSLTTYPTDCFASRHLFPGQHVWLCFQVSTKDRKEFHQKKNWTKSSTFGR